MSSDNFNYVGPDGHVYLNQSMSVYMDLCGASRDPLRPLDYELELLCEGVRPDPPGTDPWSEYAEYGVIDDSDLERDQPAVRQMVEWLRQLPKGVKVFGFTLNGDSFEVSLWLDLGRWDSSYEEIDDVREFISDAVARVEAL